MNDFNPLNIIFEIFSSKEPALVTPAMLNGMKLALNAGGVICETPQDVFKCIYVLEEMGLLLTKVDKTEDGKACLMIGNLYNGK